MRKHPLFYPAKFARVFRDSDLFSALFSIGKPLPKKQNKIKA